MIKRLSSLLILGLILLFQSILTTAQTNGGELRSGEQIIVDVAGQEELIFTYNADAETVITITVNAQNNTDTQMVLYASDGTEIASDQDNGSGLNPALIRVELPADDEYTISITDYSDGLQLNDVFSVTLLEVDLLNLSESTQSIRLGENFDFERMIFDAETGTVYQLEFEISNDYDNIIYIRFFEEDDFFRTASFDLVGITTASVIFEASKEGQVIVEFEYFAFNNPIDLTVHLETLSG